MVPTIFIDVDQTLVHSDEEISLSGGVQLAYTGESGTFFTIEREGVAELLDYARSVAPVRLLSAGIMSYVRSLNSHFGWNFKDEDILGRERWMDAEREPLREGICPNAILIDNEAPWEANLTKKLRYLGIAAERCFKVEDFWVHLPSPIGVPMLKEFLLPLLRSPQSSGFAPRRLD